MSYLLLVLLLVVLGLLALRAFLRADPKALAKGFQSYGGGALLALAVLMALIGRVALAAPLAFFGFSLLGKRIGGFGWPGGNRQKSAAQASRVRTSVLEMTLDHDTGEIDGLVLAGKFEDRTLSDLSLGELNDLYAECESANDQSAALLEAFLDRAHPDWREGAAGESARNSSRSGHPGRRDMSREEAREILGLGPDAGADEVRKAHRALIKKYHPDQGGSTFLAAQINQAKEVLLPE